MITTCDRNKLLFYSFSKQPGLAHFCPGSYVFSFSDKQCIAMKRSSINPGISSKKCMAWSSFCGFRQSLIFFTLCNMNLFFPKYITLHTPGFKYIFMASTTVSHVFLAYQVLCKWLLQILKLFSKLKTGKEGKLLEGSIPKVFVSQVPNWIQWVNCDSLCDLIDLGYHKVASSTQSSS